MILIITVAVIFIIAVAAFFLTSNNISSQTKKKKTGPDKNPFIITGVIIFLLLCFLAFQMYRTSTTPDTQCTTPHEVTYFPPATLSSATDYFAQGNYDYDTGNCRKAIIDYTKAIELSPDFPQAYNNRAYTYMRMQNYKDALSDLNKAIQLNPNYIQALMNRGDIHNYYYQIDRKAAVEDYQKVISLGGTHGTSVCGHLFLAVHNGWNLGTVVDIPSRLFSCR